MPLVGIRSVRCTIISSKGRSTLRQELKHYYATHHASQIPSLYLNVKKNRQKKQESNSAYTDK